MKQLAELYKRIFYKHWFFVLIEAEAPKKKNQARKETRILIRKRTAWEAWNIAVATANKNGMIVYGMQKV